MYDVYTNIYIILMIFYGCIIKKQVYKNNFYLQKVILFQYTRIIAYYQFFDFALKCLGGVSVCPILGFPLHTTM